MFACFCVARPRGVSDWLTVSLSLYLLFDLFANIMVSLSHGFWKAWGVKKKKKNSAFSLFRVVLTWLSMCILHSFCLLLWLFSINFFSSRNINSRTFRQHVMLSILLLSLTFFLSVSRRQFALCFKLRNQKMFFLISGKQRAIWRKIFIAMCLRWQRKES